MSQAYGQYFVFQANMPFLGEHPCPVCGFGMDRPPDDFNICPSCGVEFGYGDSGSNYEALRKEWLRHGALWASRARPRPPGWNAYDQLLHAGLLPWPIVRAYSDTAYSNAYPSEQCGVTSENLLYSTDPSAAVFDHA